MREWLHGAAEEECLSRLGHMHSRLTAGHIGTSSSSFCKCWMAFECCQECPPCFSFWASLITSIYNQAKENNHHLPFPLPAKPYSAAFQQRAFPILKVHFIFCTILIQISRCGNVHSVSGKSCRLFCCHEAPSRTVQEGLKGRTTKIKCWMFSRCREESRKEREGKAVLLCRGVMSDQSLPWVAGEAPSSSRHRSCLVWESLRSTVTPFPFRVTSFLFQSFSR